MTKFKAFMAMMIKSEKLKEYFRDRKEMIMEEWKLKAAVNHEHSKKIEREIESTHNAKLHNQKILKEHQQSYWDQK